MAFDELTLESFVWENALRAAHAVAPNLPPQPEERLPVRGNKPLEHSKYRRRWRGTPPRSDAGCGSQACSKITDYQFGENWTHSFMVRLWVTYDVARADAAAPTGFSC
jgi:hypothetical protein